MSAQALPLSQWQDTLTGLHLRTQIVGKTRLALAPPQNHWWHVTLYVTARGLTTSVLEFAQTAFEIAFDFISHEVIARTDDGRVATLPLRAQSIAEFYREYVAMLSALGIAVKLWPMPMEIANPISFAEDQRSLPYDRAAVERFFRELLEADAVLKQFRSDFLGKCSPTHFWWGSFDLACTRFSGRRAPPHPGGIPNTPDFITREAYSHECFSTGWWPGTPGGLQEPAFYAYAYPEPAGCSTAPVRPAGARYDETMREWIIPSSMGSDAALALFQHAYQTVASLGSWDPQLVRP